MNLEEEKQLVLKALHDPEAFDTLYNIYYDRILAYAFRRVLDLEVAQDITAEVFVKALSHLKSFRWRSLPFGAWLFRIASNEIVTYFRRKKHVSHSLDDLFLRAGFEVPHFVTPADELKEAEKILQEHTDFLTLHRAFQMLKEPYRTVLFLKFFEKKSLKEIADILGKKEGTVKSLVSRGIVKLRDIFKKERMQPFGD